VKWSPPAAFGEDDALGAQVVGILVPFEVAEALELTEQIVESLLADAQPSGQVGRSQALRPGVLQDVQMCRFEVGEAAFVQS